MSSEIEIKTERIVSMLEREKLGGVILNAQYNFAWITAGGSNGTDQSRENGAASIVVTAKGRRYVLANNIEMPRLLDEELSGELFEPISFAWEAEKANSRIVVENAARLAETNSVASDIPLARECLAIEPSIAPCRYSLTEEEIVRIRQLGSDVGIAIAEAIGSCEPGESERRSSERLRTALARRDIMSVVALAAGDERIGKYRHPIPSGANWQSEILLVTCAKRNGLIVSASRIASVGSASDSLVLKTNAAAFVNASIWNAAKIGTKGSELYFTAKTAYEKTGFSNAIYEHHQGGAAGYKTREWVAHPASNEVVQEHQAFAWNPSIAGTKVEDTILVSADGIENLTRSSDLPAIETEIEGAKFYSPGIVIIK